MPRPALRALLPLALSTALAGCFESEEPEDFAGGGGDLDGGGDGGDDGGDDGGGTGSDPDALQQACETGEDGEATLIPATRLSSEVTWTLDWDATAEASGYTDCTYTRTYEGLELLGFEFLCPDCDFIARGEAVMVDGADCYAQLTGDDAPETTRTELWGVAGDALMRAGRDQFPLGELATFTGTSGEGEDVSVAWESEYEVDGGGAMTLSALGTMSWLTDDETLLEDPWGPREAPYACGWECNDPGDLAGDYDLQQGDVIPNVRLMDQCGEEVDLWDFHGSYVVLDTSQFDCGPCRSMAETEHDFIVQMREMGIPVRVVTLMGDGLSNPFGTPDAETVDWWVEEYGLTDPVLYDRGFAYAVFPGFIEGYSGEDFGYPAWLVLDPEMRVIHGNVGFSTWDAVVDVIQADAEAR